jgi:hypothetical protein
MNFRGSIYIKINKIESSKSITMIITDLTTIITDIITNLVQMFELLKKKVKMLSIIFLLNQNKI